MNNFLSNLTVLNGIGKDELISSFDEALTDESAFCKFLSNLYRAGAETNFQNYVYDLILCDENAFSMTCARGKEPSKYLINAIKNDLILISQAINTFDDRENFCKGQAQFPFDNDPVSSSTIKNLAAFYKKYGYGKFIKYKAFKYEDGQLSPIEITSPVTLDELKSYEYEKKVIEDNIVNLISGLPFSHMLLYGDRGTGKSSTVHAMLNKYFDDGLRIIELSKENLLAIPDIRRAIAENPLKFILFIDDLSLGEYDEKVSSLKASLEGSVSGGGDNVMIVVTSNRRHIVKESFADRENSVHPTDSMSEQLSLSDRFSLTVMFSTTDKAQYLMIVNELASDRQIKRNREELSYLAERWAIAKGGRSPRRAKQFIDFVYSCEQRGQNVEF